mmetsp:Transcript_48542/g.115556  ORF Transcript_48542/g.115556 Transcript_48542/m.115556 type:complete len:481 (+) Transcript_48542:1375-2817(+)
MLDPHLGLRRAIVPVPQDLPVKAFELERVEPRDLPPDERLPDQLHPAVPRAEDRVDLPPVLFCVGSRQRTAPVVQLREKRLEALPPGLLEALVDDVPPLVDEFFENLRHHLARHGVVGVCKGPYPTVPHLLILDLVLDFLDELVGDRHAIDASQLRVPFDVAVRRPGLRAPQTHGVEAQPPLVEVRLIAQLLVRDGPLLEAAEILDEERGDVVVALRVHDELVTLHPHPRGGPHLKVLLLLRDLAADRTPGGEPRLVGRLRVAAEVQEHHLLDGAHQPRPRDDGLNVDRLRLGLPCDALGEELHDGPDVAREGRLLVLVAGISPRGSGVHAHDERAQRRGVAGVVLIVVGPAHEGDDALERLLEPDVCAAPGGGNHALEHVGGQDGAGVARQPPRPLVRVVLARGAAAVVVPVEEPGLEPCQRASPGGTIGPAPRGCSCSWGCCHSRRGGLVTGDIFVAALLRLDEFRHLIIRIATVFAP